MSVTPDKAVAEQKFLKALEAANSSLTLPEEWLERVTRIGASKSKTFVAMLGTALLARATDPRIDPLILRADVEAEEGFESYSARGLAMTSLAPLAVKHGVDIGAKGREPLNNQPFLRDTHVHSGMNVKENARADFEYLLATLKLIKALPEHEVELALAAFIRVRKAAAEKRVPRIKVVHTEWTTDSFIGAVSGFVTSQPEGGKRGQALVAAVFDLVYPQVDVGRVNDPSRHFPGDVYVFDNEESKVLPLRVAEVKQKIVTDSDIYLWAAELAEAGLGVGLYTALAKNQPQLDTSHLVGEVLRRHNVLIRIFTSVEEFLKAAIVWSSKAVETFFADLPLRMQERLEEMDAGHEGQEAWAHLFRADDGS